MLKNWLKFNESSTRTNGYELKSGDVIIDPSTNVEKEVDRVDMMNDEGYINVWYTDETMQRYTNKANSPASFILINK